MSIRRKAMKSGEEEGRKKDEMKPCDGIPGFNVRRRTSPLNARELVMAGGEGITGEDYNELPARIAVTESNIDVVESAKGLSEKVRVPAQGGSFRLVALHFWSPSPSTSPSGVHPNPISLSEYQGNFGLGIPDPSTVQHLEPSIYCDHARSTSSTNSNGRTIATSASQDKEDGGRGGGAEIEILHGELQRGRAQTFIITYSEWASGVRSSGQDPGSAERAPRFFGSDARKGKDCKAMGRGAGRGAKIGRDRQDVQLPKAFSLRGGQHIITRRPCRGKLSPTRRVAFGSGFPRIKRNREPADDLREPGKDGTRTGQADRIFSRTLAEGACGVFGRGDGGGGGHGRHEVEVGFDAVAAHEGGQGGGLNKTDAERAVWLFKAASAQVRKNEVSRGNFSWFAPGDSVRLSLEGDLALIEAQLPRPPASHFTAASPQWN
ncbi:hypothetical protein BDK51DRAFT_33395 [Blyttiomyces helicus]|uniref:Uncharacterized protein n=1 Tax=Blyttiomyces helicus TaxID=388810 RepID=A0A4P9VZ91_9FUNG|nr:hypothetical protein BDK51DRAFT_33395 [Blyttiomyces helicus]|eukprot:RKO83670.1 hypothetical protein BDK51DRAFT_33395 [Blyttiomyces helicus]